MPTVGIVTSARYLEHDVGPHHPEHAGRIRSIQKRLHEKGWFRQAKAITPRPIDLDLVERVHTRDYINRFKAACSGKAGYLDTPECPVVPVSFEIARLAAGGCIAAVDAVMASQIDRAFCAIRPPGHHAERDRAMGFCFFNNVAIAAEHLRTHHKIERVAILDWDVHHGNGTQHHFEPDPNVFFCSLHQHPRTLYPGTGFEKERGVGPGEGFTLNITMMPGSGDKDYRRAFDLEVLPALRKFQPGFLLVSAGFDAHRNDPLAQIELSTEMFGWMTRQVGTLAESVCGNRLVSVLEGGYHLEALADSVEVHLAGLVECHDD